MIVPLIGIFLVSLVVWSLLGLISGGLAAYVNESITGMFITLFGIRVALSLTGDQRATDYRMLIVYAVTYGLAVMIASGATMFATDLLALLAAGETTGGKITLWNYANSEKRLQAAYFLTAFAWKAPLALVLFTTVYVLFAVPIANAARAAGHGAPSAAFLSGIGKHFVPLCVVFGTSFLFQFFFDIFTILYVTLPLFAASLQLVFDQTLADIDFVEILRGMAFAAGLLWLKSWTWSASALALTMGEAKTRSKSELSRGQRQEMNDIRALREARQKSASNPD